MRWLTSRFEIHVGVLPPIAAHAARRGLDFDNLLRTVGLRAEDVASPEGFVSLDRFARLLEISAQQSGEDTFGIEAAAAADYRTIGALDYAVVNAPTLRDAFTALVRYLPARVDLSRFELLVDNGRARIEWSVSPMIVSRHQYNDFIAGALASRVTHMVGQAWKPAAVQLERPTPRSTEAHRQILGAAISFGQDVNSIAFPMSMLDLPIIYSDSVLHRLAVSQCERELSERLVPRDFLSRLQGEISGVLSREGGPQIEHVARRMGISVRSLQRRLQQEGTSFYQELDETRKNLAERYLGDTEARFSQIAFQLGFSAQSAFTRATYRWFGKSPSEVRRRLSMGSKIADER